MIDALRGGLVVSVQAPEGSPLREPSHMAAIARAAEQGGAVGIRANGAADVAAIRAVLGLPLIGLNKRVGRGLAGLHHADARRRALVVRRRRRHRRRRRDRARAALHARRADRRGRDVAGAWPTSTTLAAGVAARAAGAAVVATTLAGYTDALSTEGPDVQLVRELVRVLDCPVIAEGRYASPEAVRAAFVAGAHAVVVGTAITNPVELTRRFAAVARG